MDSNKQIVSLLRERELEEQEEIIQSLISQTKAEFALRGEDPRLSELQADLIDQLFAELGAFYNDYLAYDGSEGAFHVANLVSVVGMPSYKAAVRPCWPASGVLIPGIENEVMLDLFLDVNDGTIYSQLHMLQRHAMVLTKDLLFSLAYSNVFRLLSKVRIARGTFVFDNTGMTTLLRMAESQAVYID